MLIARNEICMIPDCYVCGSIICFLLCMYIAYATLCLNVYIIGKFIYFSYDLISTMLIYLNTYHCSFFKSFGGYNK